jgi:hypothetical protein
MVWLVLSLGRPPDETAFKIFHGAMGVALTLLVRHAGSRAAASPAVGNLAATLLVLSPLFWDTEAVGLAELPLALWATAGMAAAMEAPRAGARAILAAGVAWGFLPWIKPEGYSLGVLLGAASAPWVAETERRARGAALFLAGFAPLFAGAWAVQRYLLPDATYFLAGDGWSRAAERLPRTAEILRYVGRELWAADWLLLWPSLLVASVAALARRNLRAGALLAVVWVQTSIYAATAFLTFLDPLRHLRAAFFRIEAALVPLGLIALAVLLAPEAGGGRDAARPTEASGSSP